MTSGPTTSPRIFLSYRRNDVPDAVDRIADRLKTRFGDPDVFVDISAIRAGDKWQDKLFQALYRCEVFLVVIGPDWLGAQRDDGTRALDHAEDFVRQEIEFALKREISIIPVLWNDAKLPDPDTLPASIRGLPDYQAFTMRRDHFDSDVDLLFERVEAQVKLLATLGRRGLAFAIDLIPPALVNLAVGGTPLTFWLVVALYHGLAVGGTGRTLGKWALGTRVDSDQPTVRSWIFGFARPLLGYPFVLLSGIGTLQMVLHPQRIAVHDRLFHVRVVQTRRRPVVAAQRQIDSLSQVFDQWMFKLLRGVRLGFLIWWAKSFFGIDSAVRWLEERLSHVIPRGEGTSPLGTGTAGQPAASSVAGIGAPAAGAAAAGAGTAGAAGATAGASILSGASAVGAGALAAMAAPLAVGAVLAVGSILLYERLTPNSLSLVNPQRTVVIDGQPITGSHVLVFADTSGSLGPEQLAAADSLIAALDRKMDVRRINVYTGNLDPSMLGMWDILDSVYTRGVDAVYIFSDFADSDDPDRLDSLRQYLGKQNLKLYLGTVGNPPDSLLSALAIGTGGGLVTHIPVQPP